MTRSLESEGETKGDKSQDKNPGRTAGSSRTAQGNLAGPPGPGEVPQPGAAACTDRQDDEDGGPAWRDLKARAARRPARTRPTAGPDGRLPPLAPAVPPPPPQVDLQTFQRWSENGAGICLWSYVTRHSLEQVLETPGYFDRLKHHGLQRHDRIVMTAAANGKEPVHADFVVVQPEVSPQEGRHIALARLR